MRVAVISDTHLPRGNRRLPDRCVEELRAADLVLHAGDVATVEVLEEIEALAGCEVLAVLGNVDELALYRPRRAAHAEVEAEGARIAMVHDAGPALARWERLRARFPDADVVVFGHSHIPLHEDRDGLQIFNPGSPTDRRRQPQHTMGVADVAGRRRPPAPPRRRLSAQRHRLDLEQPLLGDARGRPAASCGGCRTRSCEQRLQLAPARVAVVVGRDDDVRGDRGEARSSPPRRAGRGPRRRRAARRARCRSRSGRALRARPRAARARRRAAGASRTTTMSAGDDERGDAVELARCR